LHVANLVATIAPHREVLGVRRTLLWLGGVECGPGTRIANRVSVCGRYLRVGSNVFIGAETSFYSSPQGRIGIGENVAIAPRCLFASGTHAMGPSNARACTNCANPIHIGDGCDWGWCHNFGGVHIAPG
jgi:acetyltransferase-like isoleucine patch superfamily enzyme